MRRAGLIKLEEVDPVSGSSRLVGRASADGGSELGGLVVTTSVVVVVVVVAVGVGTGVTGAGGAGLAGAGVVAAVTFMVTVAEPVLRPH